MHKKVLAIFSPNQNAYSETFIQAHKNLPFQIKFYHSGRLPTQLEGRYALADNFSRIEKFKKQIFKKFTEKEYGLYYSLKRENAACVLAEYAPTACNSLQVIKALRLPLVVHFHGLDANIETILKTFGAEYKKVFEYAHTVVAVSKQMKLKLIQLGCPPGKILLSYYGPDRRFFDNQPKYIKPQFVFIGRFVEKKAPHLTIKAFKIVADKCKDATLIMAGNGPLLSLCKEQAAELNIDNKVQFTGVLAHEEIKQLLEESTVFVQHSVIAENGDAEGTPVSILEAQAAALPVVSTYHAGIPDVIVHNETGFLVNEHDVQGMADYMYRLICNRSLVMKMGCNARKRIQDFFTMEKHLNALADKISEAITVNN